MRWEDIFVKAHSAADKALGGTANPHTIGVWVQGYMAGHEDGERVVVPGKVSQVQITAMIEEILAEQRISDHDGLALARASLSRALSVVLNMEVEEA